MENEGTWIDWQYLQNAAALLKKVNGCEQGVQGSRAVWKRKWTGASIPQKSPQSLWTESHIEEDTRGQKSGSAGRVEEELTTERGRDLRLKEVGTCDWNR